MKRVLTESNDGKKEEEAEKRQQINDTFRTAPFTELVRRTQPKVRIKPLIVQLILLFFYSMTYCKIN